MAAMGLPKWYMAVIVGKHLSNVYRELTQEKTDCIPKGELSMQGGLASVGSEEHSR
jgi:hypothetical protein